MVFAARVAVASVLLLVMGSTVHAGYGHSEFVQLEDVKVITAKQGRMTIGRWSSPVPQMKCMGGTAGCAKAPVTMQCYNRGFDGHDVQWEYKADLDNSYRLGDLKVVCKG